MKKTTFLLAIIISVFTLSSFSLKADTKVYSKKNGIHQTKIDGKTLFNKNICSSCHAPDKVGIGPSIKQIAQSYKGDSKAILEFLEGKSQPIVHPEEFDYMKAVLALLKKMKSEERQALADYIASLHE